MRSQFLAQAQKSLRCLLVVCSLLAFQVVAVGVFVHLLASNLIAYTSTGLSPKCLCVISFIS